VVTKADRVDASLVEESASRIRDLNEKLINLAKESGQASIDTYEKTLQSMLEFEKGVASSSQLDWVTALANSHAKFVQDVTSFYVKAAREVLK
jgi:hypothetical protein